MHEIFSRELLAAQASDAAERAVRLNAPQPNPYPQSSEAHAQFHKRYCIALLRFSAPDAAENGKADQLAEEFKTRRAATESNRRLK